MKGPRPGAPADETAHRRPGNLVRSPETMHAEPAEGQRRHADKTRLNECLEMLVA